MDIRPLILMLTESSFECATYRIQMLCAGLNRDFLCLRTSCQHCPVETKLHKTIEAMHSITEPLRGLRERNWE